MYCTVYKGGGSSRMCGRRYISYLGPLLLPDNAWIGPRHINAHSMVILFEQENRK